MAAESASRRVVCPATALQGGIGIVAEKIDLPDDEAQAAEISLRIANELRQRRGQSYRALCRELGLPERNHGLLSKAVRGLPISAASERTIGRALGVLPPARKVRRVSVAAIPLAEIRRCAELANSAAVLQWLERVDKPGESE